MINSDLQNIFTGLLNNGLRVLFKRHFDHEYSIKIGQLSIFTSSSEWKTGVALVTWQRLAQIKNVGQPSVLLNPHQLCQCCTVAALRLNASWKLTKDNCWGSRTLVRKTCVTLQLIKTLKCQTSKFDYLLFSPFRLTSNFGNFEVSEKIVKLKEVLHYVAWM